MHHYWTIIELANLQAHVEYETSKRHYAHVDCPGHADYVKVSVGWKFVAYTH